MLGQYGIEVTTERLLETAQAIEVQRRHVDDLRDPIAKATAARTLATLEDVRLIMERTLDLLVKRESVRSAADV